MSDDTELLRVMVRAGTVAVALYSGEVAPTEREMALAEAYDTDNFGACVASMKAALAVVRAWPMQP